ncbi:putative PfkB-family carbohydrate kinase [Actinoplanes missouriensis 431]|uniref:Putative PfkB-family carbohydrate kinase n=1 Tax=Actinoplanes missouriensis (strain ATCC 14538 / DSM 43046 / CBS 188.64 / JCM 3121 / NBRC 102363 / NCIMB 12654 / NRRL B-3342 / UNCC 431) TaxID=512565 RepID=I0HGE6_ACTM4|nr:PfkB family carbohydrate kinase [Actinoplanes missouriensis]BAL92083.1 putative PfkB-family carbohydrate kinase [Actinoplanes missouriensis 431]
MIIVVGDLVTDVLVEHDGPVQPGSDTDAAIRVGGGGQAANTAAWLAHTGHPVTLVSAVGDDAAGRDRVAELSDGGVRCAVQVCPGTATGSVVVLTSAGERTMITDRGASLLLGPAHVTAVVDAAPDGTHVHLSGYPLLHAGSRDAGLAALAAAARRGFPVSVDAASAAPLRSVGASAFLDWVRGSALLLCNADEADVLAGPGSPGEQARRLTAHVHAAVVKQGAAGAVWSGRDGSEVGGRAQAVPMKDPTGAGDAFAAGLLAARCSGASPREALAAGAELGARAVAVLGARPS